MREGESAVIRHRAGARPAAALLLLSLVLLQLALLDAGGLHAAVALAATATTAAASALVVCALLLARCAPAVPPTRVRTAIRDRDLRTAFLPQRDPDAAGRRRPRAPGAARTTTVVA
ncbi:membrane protein [Streptomyces sp. e14]|nr:membrane protein [Streptomyces sp. e14]